MQLFELKGFPFLCISQETFIFFLHLQGLLVSTIFCFFNGEVSCLLFSYLKVRVTIFNNLSYFFYCLYSYYSLNYFSKQFLKQHRCFLTHICWQSGAECVTGGWCESSQWSHWPRSHLALKCISSNRGTQGHNKDFTTTRIWDRGTFWLWYWYFSVKFTC